MDGLRVLGEMSDKLLDRIAAVVPGETAWRFRRVPRRLAVGPGLLESLRAVRPREAERLWAELDRPALRPELIVPSHQSQLARRLFLVSRGESAAKLDVVVTEADVAANRLFIPSVFTGPARTILRRVP